MSDLLYPDESYAIMGACFSIYSEKGCGFLEPIYQECMEIELDYLSIPFRAEPSCKLAHRGRTLRKTFEPDFICYDKIIVELKAVPHILDEHRAKVINYLHATRLRLGILVNFGHYPKLEYERFVLKE